MSVVKNYGVHRGSDIEITTTVSEPITGWALAFVISASRGGAVLDTLTTGDGDIVISDGAEGVCVITVASASIDLAGGVYYYHLKRTDSGSKATIQEGRLVLSPVSAA